MIAPHPHAYTLELLRLSLTQLPSAFPEEDKRTFTARLERFAADPAADYDEIRQALIDLGKESWPYRKAYEDVYARYGRSSEESHLLNFLDNGVRKKYEEFIHGGGKLNYLERARTLADLTQPTPFERFFSPEEKFAIEQALLSALDAARVEINELITGPKLEDFTSLVAQFKKKERGLTTKIEDLRSLAAIEPKWEAEILDKVRTFEEGWSLTEREANERELDEELETWRGTLQSFLNA